MRLLPLVGDVFGLLMLAIALVVVLAGPDRWTDPHATHVAQGE